MLSFLAKHSHSIRIRSTLFHGVQYYFCTHKAEEFKSFDVIKTAEEGSEWMKNIKKKLSETHPHKNVTHQLDDHYSRHLNTVNDDIWFGVDTEFRELQTGRSPYNNTEILMLQVYGDWTNNDGANGKKAKIMDKPVIFQLFDPDSEQLNSDLLLSIKDFLTDSQYSKVFHNYSVDAHTINNALRDVTGDKECTLNGFAADSMHLARLLDAGSSDNSLKGLSMKYNAESIHKTKAFTESAEEILGQKMTAMQMQYSMKYKPDDFYEYAASDPVVTFELCCKLKHLLSKQKSRLRLYDPVQTCTLWDIYQSIWRPFGALLVEMESNGMHIDLDYLSQLQEESMKDKANNLEKFLKWAEETTGDANIKYLNCRSRVQLAYLFFGDENDEVMIKTGAAMRKQDESIPKQFKLPSLGLAQSNTTPTGRIQFTKKTLDELIEAPQGLSSRFNNSETERIKAIECVSALRDALSISTQISTFILPLQKFAETEDDQRLHFSLNLNTETGRLSCRSPNLQNQPSQSDIFKVRKSFTAQNEDNTLIIADYAQLELRVLAYLSGCESMREAFESGGDFHSRTAASMYPHIQTDLKQGNVSMDGANDENIPLLKDKYKKERHHAKTVNFSIAYGKTAVGLATDLDISTVDANDILKKWYDDRIEVKLWQQRQIVQAVENGYSYSIIGRGRKLFDPLNDLCCGDEDVLKEFSNYVRSEYNINGADDDGECGHMNKRKKVSGNSKRMSDLWRAFLKRYKTEYISEIDDALNAKLKVGEVPLNAIMRQAINSPVQSSAADIVVKCMLNIWENQELRELGYRLLLQIHDEVILEGPRSSVERAMEIVKQCMEIPWPGMKRNVLFKADVKHSDNWYDGK